MKKTINVTLGGLVFSIEEDGYTRLNTYLESIKNHFNATTYGSEVITDIESRIAELFNAKTAGNTQRAITDADVAEVLKSIGSVEDFGETTQEKNTDETATPGKKLYRSSDDVMIGGVASGIATYFGVDTILIRLIFLIVVFAWGTGILLYILLWILLPQAKTAGQKSEMKGAPVTLKQFEQTAKEKIAEAKASGAIQKVLNSLASIVRWFFRIILGIIGVSLTFAAAIALFATTFSFANLLFNRNSPYVDFPVASVFHGSEYFVALALGFLAVIIPLIYLGLGGITIIRLKKPPINAMLATFLSIVWLASAIGVGVFAINKAPAIEAAVKEYQGEVETRAISDLVFNKIDASSAYKLNVTPGKAYAVSIIGHAKDLDKTEIKTDNGTLEIGRKDNFEICFFCWNDEVTVNITMPALESVKGSGAVEYTIGKFASPNFDVDLSGASRVDISSLTATTTKIELSGASRITLVGTSKTFSADLSGASKIDGFDFKVEDATIETSGASHVELSISKTLSAKASGASKILYHGTPTITNQNQSGSSDIRSE